MSAIPVVVAALGLLAATAPSAARHLSEFGIVADASEIRRIISGKTCLGANGSELTFGISTPDSPGTFVRAGAAPAKYQIGYGTLLVERDRKFHSHVVVVTVDDGQFHLGGEMYRC